MYFSKLGRGLTRSSRSRNLLYGTGGLRSAIEGGGILLVPRVSDVVLGRLGFWRGYLAAIGGRNKLYLSDLNHALANPRISRFFSRNAPKNKKSMALFFLSVVFAIIYC
ncbi:hypothetical protein Patl1_31308 [Pistacia atlantica]|uniref:Uncharacterized protein n=1 Tax=Pistacia atlantica TaxID=434234 RepID=A0ACC1ADU3_9ROSI|nr:hypothetical protein Patl1_31308 [Pistacia atlantica]